MNEKMNMLKSKSLIFCQIIYTNKLFTLKFIMYIRSHIISLEFLYTPANSEIDATNKFVLYSVKEIQPWVALYEEKRKKWDRDRKSFRWFDGRSMPYPNHLK